MTAVTAVIAATEADVRETTVAEDAVVAEPNGTVAGPDDLKRCCPAESSFRRAISVIEPRGATSVGRRSRLAARRA